MINQRGYFSRLESDRQKWGDSGYMFGFTVTNKARHLL